MSAFYCAQTRNPGRALGCSIFVFLLFLKGQAEVLQRPGTGNLPSFNLPSLILLHFLIVRLVGGESQRGAVEAELSRQQLGTIPSAMAQHLEQLITQWIPSILLAKTLSCKA
jgi:hypothetical protein